MEMGPDFFYGGRQTMDLTYLAFCPYGRKIEWGLPTHRIKNFGRVSLLSEAYSTFRPWGPTFHP